MSNINIPQWQRYEHSFTSAVTYPNPLQDAQLDVVLMAPSGRRHTIAGFWDGDTNWRMRFAPNEIGEWRYVTHCSDTSNKGLHEQTGMFTCTPPLNTTRFTQHGPVRLADNRRYLAHWDGTPFFWLADTAWLGPLRATAEEWTYYLHQRSQQGFTAVQWMTTQTLAAPDGDRDGQLAFTGQQRIAINPVFFQRLDPLHEAIGAAGLLSAPVLLWAAEWSDAATNALNPGFSLPDDQCILLARYMVARWGAQPVLWILGGDSPYPSAERWQRIGRAVFASGSNALVALHLCGVSWLSSELRDEAWLDIIGYQSGHGDNAETLRWLTEGPPARNWPHEPSRPSINLEPPYENHVSYHSKLPFNAHAVRRALYWSLLVAPPAGVSYGGHGVWGWDDGSEAPTNHESTGVPLPWREALHMAAAEQIRHIATLFSSLPRWRLLPATTLLASQPGASDPRRHIAVAVADDNTVVVAYVPEDRTIHLRRAALPVNLRAAWFDPRTGQCTAVTAHANDDDVMLFDTPGPGDWVLVLEATAPN